MAAHGDLCVVVICFGLYMVPGTLGWT